MALSMYDKTSQTWLSGSNDKNLVRLRDRKDELVDLRARQDRDADFFNLTPYVMRDGNTKVDEVTNITSNKPRTDADRIISAVAGAIMTKEVKGPGVSESQASVVEAGFDALEVLIDDWLPRYHAPSLRKFESEQVAIRGGICARVLFRKDDVTGEPIPDVLPADFRNFTWQTDLRGNAWCAYESQRSIHAVIAEWGEQIKDKNITMLNPDTIKKVDVVDLWDRDAAKNIVYLNGALVIEQEMPMDQPPWAFEASQHTTTLLTEDFWKHFAESIYASDRDLFDEMNAALSITQSLLKEQFLGALQVPTRDGTGKPKHPPRKKRTVVPYDPELGPYTVMPLNDLHTAGRLSISLLAQLIQQGLLSDMEYGNLTFPLSAVAIGKLTSAKDLIFIPLLQTIALFRRQLYKIITMQITKGDLVFEVPMGSKLTTVSKDTFNGKYQTSFKFSATSPEQDMANISVAASLGNQVDEGYKLREILHVRNPEEIERNLRIEAAELTNPIQAARKQCFAYIDADDDVGAWTAFYNLQTVTQQTIMMMGQPPAEQGGGQPSMIGGPPPGSSGSQTPAPMMPLIGGHGGDGGGGARGPKPAKPDQVPNPQAELRKEEASV